MKHLDKDFLKLFTVCLLVSVLTFLTLSKFATKETGVVEEPVVEVYASEPAIVTETPIAETLVVEKPVEVEEAKYKKFYTEQDAIVVAKMLWGESRGVQDYITRDGRVVSSKAQKAACVWTVLNRVDAGYGDTVTAVVTAPRQYHGYNKNNPVDEELLAIAHDVLYRWNLEKNGESNVGRVLPPDYLWFYGDGRFNYFRNEYKTRVNWSWALEDVYAYDH